MITYKKAAGEDIDELSEIRCEFLKISGYLDEKDEKELKKACKVYFNEAFADESFAAWLACDDDKIVATSGICFYSIPPNKTCPNGKTAYIQNMYTKEKYREQGIAKTLFEKTVNEARIRGCTKVLLTATEMGRPLYEKFGFEKSENEMEYHL